MRKAFTMIVCLFAMLASGVGLRAQEIIITLNPGWTWISYPLSDTLSFSDAMGSFVPMTGDKILSKDGSASYRNGVWRGRISEFCPGNGYMYQSSRSEPVTMSFVSLAAFQVAVTTAEPTDVTLYSFVGGGQVTHLVYCPISLFGLCWNTAPNPTVTDNQAIAGYGMASFTWDVACLQPNTTYYVRAYALTEKGIVYGEQKMVKTKSGIPELTTNEVTGIGMNQATCGGTITDDGGLEITARGICWSTSPEPTVADTHTTDGDGIGGFVSTMTGLTPNTTYYVRAYATNSHTTAYGEEMSFTTVPMSFMVTLSANPVEGGTVSGGGVVVQDHTCTVTATANTGYDFVSWTEDGNVVSTNPSYSFVATADRTLVANFQIQSFAIAASADPTVGGTVSGGGTYDYGTSCTLAATPNTGYDFVNWTEDGSPVSTEANYTFTVTGERSLVAHFQLKTYTVAATANPTEGGTVSGSGTYTHGQSCTVTATPNTGYDFVNWTENGTPVSTNPTYTITVTSGHAFVANFQLKTYIVAATANPAEGGNITGSGTYTHGQNCTLTATPNTSYEFVNWTEDGTPVSTNPTYTFTVTSGRTFVAHFQLKTYTITVSANLEEGGTVTGGGIYTHGQSCTVTATVNTRFGFVNWTENDEEVSVDAEYTFTVTGPRSLVANFEELYPAGAINGLFSVSETKRVYFSQGNLQYIGSAATPYWKFADHQWDYLGDNGQGSTSSTVDRDLFGFGTSGYNHGAVCYQPWSTSTTYQDYMAYGWFEYFLFDQTGQADWGYNAISNGGNQENFGWRTLYGGNRDPWHTGSEWDYLFNRRPNASSLYGQGKVNGVNGMILLPDEWTLPDGLSFTSGDSEYSNVYSEEQWSQMEANGAVFLPSAGHRDGTSFVDMGTCGRYNSSSPTEGESSRFFMNWGSGYHGQTYSWRYLGFSVRLVLDAE